MLLDKQHGVISRRQAASLGLSSGAVKYRIRTGGPWQRMFPGVYLVAGPAWPRDDQLDMAALLYAGSHSVITGAAALRRYGIRPGAAGIVDVLVPAGSNRADCGYVRVHRTRRLPARVATQGPIRITMIPRAVTDAALQAGSERDMRAIVTAGVHRGRCPLDDLVAELGRSRLPGSAMLRSVVADVAAGILSSPEGDLMDLINRSGLPAPLYNPRLFLNGRFLAMPDAWWEAVGVAAEVDSREYHFDEAAWNETMRRHDRMTAAGIRVLHFSPARIRSQPDWVIETIRKTLASGLPIPGLRTVQAVATR